MPASFWRETGSHPFDLQHIIPFEIGLPFYIATEVITRGLIALRDTRTPLFTNSGQLIARIVLITVLLPSMGVVAIPAAFAISATIETLTLATVLFLKLRSRSLSQQ